MGSCSVMRSIIRYIVIGLVIVMGMILLTRFISYKVHEAELSPPPVKCVPANQARFDEEGFEIISQDPPCEVLESINRVYLQKVKPVLQVKCLMCHGIADQVPLYAIIPPASWLVKRDMQNAKKRMDMRYDFPFLGHGAPNDDLEALAKVVREDSMPPLRYKLMHWRSGLTENEKELLLKWVQESLQTLNRQGG